MWVIANPCNILKKKAQCKERIGACSQLICIDDDAVLGGTKCLGLETPTRAYVGPNIAPSEIGI